MGSFSNVMSGLSLVSELAGGLGGIAQDRADYRALQAQQNAQFQYAQQQAAQQRAEIDQKAAAEEATRQAALRRAVARQRAAYGASGITADDGSGRAVLLGLFDESEAEKRRREELDKLRYQAIDSDLAHRRTVNMLNLSAARTSNNIAMITGLAKTASGTARLFA